MSRYSRAMLLALVALALAPHVAATTVEPLDDSALVERSAVIARVVVTSARAERVGRRVLTFYEVDVVDTWHARDAAGAQVKRTVVALPGGVVDGIGQLVPGTPRLQVGKQYVLCLGDDNGPSGARGVVGLWQGAFGVVDAAGARLRPFTHGAPSSDVDSAALRQRFTVRR